MSFDNSPSSQDKPNTSMPPPPLPGNNTWSPPLPQLAMPGTIAQQPWAGDNQSFNITLSPGRVIKKDQLSEFRTGQIIAGPEAVTITGKATPPNSTRTLVLVITLVVIRFGFIIAYLIMEYALRRDRTDIVYWSNIDGIAYDREKGRLCISYHMPEKPKVSYAIGTKVDNYSLDAFLRLANQYAPGVVRDTKILPATPAWLWVFLAVLLVGLIAIAIWTSGHH